MLVEYYDSFAENSGTPRGSYKCLPVNCVILCKYPEEILCKYPSAQAYESLESHCGMFLELWGSWSCLNL
jgi:hypothetical protein